MDLAEAKLSKMLGELELLRANLPAGGVLLDHLLLQRSQALLGLHEILGLPPHTTACIESKQHPRGMPRL